MAVKSIRGERFDIGSGYIKKSPCRNCLQKKRLPECSNNCGTLNKIQKLLAGTISCSNTLSEYETHCPSRFDF